MFCVATRVSRNVQKLYSGFIHICKHDGCKGKCICWYATRKFRLWLTVERKCILRRRIRVLWGQGNEVTNRQAQLCPYIPWNSGSRLSNTKFNVKIWCVPLRLHGLARYLDQNLYKKFLQHVYAYCTRHGFFFFGKKKARITSFV